MSSSSICSAGHAQPGPPADGRAEPALFGVCLGSGLASPAAKLSRSSPADGSGHRCTMCEPRTLEADVGRTVETGRQPKQQQPRLTGRQVVPSGSWKPSDETGQDYRWHGNQSGQCSLPPPKLETGIDYRSFEWPESFQTEDLWRTCKGSSGAKTIVNRDERPFALTPSMSSGSPFWLSSCTGSNRPAEGGGRSRGHRWIGLLKLSKGPMTCRISGGAATGQRASQVQAMPPEA
jgi:hypothetical protein